MFTRRSVKAASEADVEEQAVPPVSAETMIQQVLDTFRYSWTGINSSPRIRPATFGTWIKGDWVPTMKSRSVNTLGGDSLYHQQSPQDLLLAYVLLTVRLPLPGPSTSSLPEDAMVNYTSTISELQKITNERGDSNMVVSEMDNIAVGMQMKDLIDIFTRAAPVINKSLDAQTILLCEEDLTDRKGAIRNESTLKLFVKPDYEDILLMQQLTSLFQDLRKRHSPTLYARGMIALEARVRAFHLEMAIPKDTLADAYLRTLIFPALAREPLGDIFKPVEVLLKQKDGLLMYLFFSLVYPDRTEDYTTSWKEIEQYIPYGLSDYFWGFKNVYNRPGVPFPAFFEKEHREEIDKFLPPRMDTWKFVRSLVGRKSPSTPQ